MSALIEKKFRSLEKVKRIYGMFSRIALICGKTSRDLMTSECESIIKEIRKFIQPQ